MSKRGSALMQVMVIGLIVAAFSVLILRYAITRSSNLSRTERILKTQITADSCLDQYMNDLALHELYGVHYSTETLNMDCMIYEGFIADSTSTVTMFASSETPDPISGSFRIVTTFTLATNPNPDL